jgi:sugar phosphate isomerase/epimerase
MEVEMNLGVRAHNFGKLPLEVLADKVSEKGFTAIQLALAKAIEDIDTGLGKLSPGMAYKIGNTFSKKNIQIAVLGCYINPIHPDKEQRRMALDRFKEHIRYARDFGCSIVGTETGTLSVDTSFNPDNHSEIGLRAIIESVSELVEEAEKFGVIVGIEAGTKNPIHSSEKMKYLLDSIKSNNLQVIFDPMNLMTLENYKNQQEVYKEAFELYGDRIAIVHTKDLKLEEGTIKTTPVGTGLLEYEPLMKLIKERKPYINILIEDTKEEYLDGAKKYLKDIYDRA